MNTWFLALCRNGGQLLVVGANVNINGQVLWFTWYSPCPPPFIDAPGVYLLSYALLNLWKLILKLLELGNTYGWNISYKKDTFIL